MNKPELPSMVSTQAEIEAFSGDASEQPIGTSERFFALREGHHIAAERGYFDARPQIDTNDRRNVSKAGFGRGFEARDGLASQASLAKRGTEPSDGAQPNPPPDHPYPEGESAPSEKLAGAEALAARIKSCAAHWAYMERIDHVDQTKVDAERHSKLVDELAALAQAETVPHAPAGQVKYADTNSPEFQAEERLRASMQAEAPAGQFRALLRSEIDKQIDVSGDVARQEAQIDMADHLLVKFNELFPEAS